ncbi:TatD family hydrolase [Akkermansiaceae bacterium]|jgi:TatD DNase family protein|nr:TatD family hydrolase [Akkermansiaceae bacterium]MDB4518222.1 TatD family hydrolase [Akkermansiaceae bacterium]
MLIDSHNHLADPRFDGKRDRIIEEMKSAGIVHCVVNGTGPTDWPIVADLAEKHPAFITPSFGLHPWRIHDFPDDWLPSLAEYLQRFPRAGLGECGLDRWMTEPNFSSQIEVFEKQLALAAKLNRPTTIHCLKAWGALLDCLRSAPALPPILIHSFGGSLETGRELAKLGAYFSFSGVFLDERKAKQLDIFTLLPADRLLLETDAPNMLPPADYQKYPIEGLNHPANLQEISRAFFNLTQITIDQHVKRSVKFFKIDDFSR